ncbi:MobA/MobL family protein [Parasedimentitalea psychrophila]|uniref:MobA/MobL family protein n=1 Tax=Parasedimentitalea psychrophila TaxID=2997337 RepID=A0A9Y2L4D8_9RHOB|nr:MobA/MobL family protein [Parasedimentitalea psychrophila]WIY27387.1 MobA/MobL family protein [Parasedimentitalea psychrophila]
MALFSFRHSVKTFSEKCRSEIRTAQLGQTEAHLAYITRPKATRVVLQERLSGDTRPRSARNAEEAAQKSKGRVCERIMLALPVEVSPEQREALARAFAERLTQGIAGYVVGIHDKHGNDTRNPHAHFVFFDVKEKTGGRGRPKSILGFARKNAIENTAKMWTELHNGMMHKWGFGSDSEISHLSYANRRIDHIPTIHEGTGARATPKTKKMNKKEWRHIDQGHTRAEANLVIREINELKENQTNERELRLGTSNGDNSAQRGGGVSKQREFAGSEFRTPAEYERPSHPAKRTKSGHCDTGKNTNPISRQVQAGARCRQGRQSRFPPLARFGLARHLRGRRRIRRIYRELIMLRDTLRARLLPNEWQRRLRSDDTRQKEARQCLRQQAKPRISEAELFE